MIRAIDVICGQKSERVKRTRTTIKTIGHKITLSRKNLKIALTGTPWLPRSERRRKTCLALAFQQKVLSQKTENTG